MNDALFRPSSMLRRKLCPGSLALESTLPAKVGDEPDDPYQAQGRKLHRLVADPSLPRDDCSPSELELIEAVDKTEAEFLNRILQGQPVDCIRHSERAFLFIRDDNDRVLFTGTPDAVWAFKEPRIAVVFERKFGFKEVQHADANLQLRAYLVMVADVYPADAYYGIITQPRISSKPFIVEYTPADIVKARAEIEAVYDACYAPDPPRRASNEACNFCDVKALCPEHKAWLGEIQKVGHLPVAQWTDAQMEIFEERRTAALKFIEDVHEQIKQIKAADPERLPGYRLKDGAKVRTVTDLVESWSRLKSILSEGLGTEQEAAKQYSACCSVSIGDLEDLIYNIRKDGPQKLSQKETKRLVNNLLSSLIEFKQNRPTLVKDE